MSTQPGEPPAGAGTRAAAEAARGSGDPGDLQVDLTGDADDEDIVDGDALAPGVHETDKAG